MNPSVIVFDIDDTLYPEIEFIKSGFEVVAQQIGTAKGLPATEVLDQLWAVFKQEGSGAVFDRVMKNIDENATEAQIQALVEAYRHHTPHIKPFPHLREFLDKAQSQDKKLAIITDGHRDIQHGKLHALGLDGRFENFFFTPEFGKERMKPHPMGFEKMQALYPDEKLAYIADNRKKDFYAPNLLGWYSIRFFHPAQIHKHKEAPSADYLAQTEVSTYQELEALLLS